MEKEEGKLVKNWIERFEIGIEQLENDQKWWKKLAKTGENEWKSMKIGLKWAELNWKGENGNLTIGKWPKMAKNWSKLVQIGKKIERP